MTLNSDDFCKHGQIYAQLLESFSSGKYKIGERVPSEREVAAALQVNIRTVRRAFRDLILGGIVEKKGRFRNLSQSISPHCMGKKACQCNYKQ